MIASLPTETLLEVRRRLAADDLLGARAALVKYSDDQPRDDQGRFASGGGGEAESGKSLRALGAAMSSSHALVSRDLASYPGADKVKATLSSWSTSTERSMAAQRSMVRYLADPSGNPTSGAEQVAEALRGAQPDAPELYRGMSWAEGGDAHGPFGGASGREFLDGLKPGASVDLPPCSWSESKDEATGFAPYVGVGGEHVGVVMKVEQGSAGLNISGMVAGRFGFQKEWLGGGRYQVVGVQRVDLSQNEAYVRDQARYSGGVRAARAYLSQRTRYEVTLRQSGAFS